MASPATPTSLLSFKFVLALLITTSYSILSFPLLSFILYPSLSVCLFSLPHAFPQPFFHSLTKYSYPLNLCPHRIYPPPSIAHSTVLSSSNLTYPIPFVSLTSSFYPPSLSTLLSACYPPHIYPFFYPTHFLSTSILSFSIPSSIPLLSSLHLSSSFFSALLSRSFPPHIYPPHFYPLFYPHLFSTIISSPFLSPLLSPPFLLHIYPPHSYTVLLYFILSIPCSILPLLTHPFYPSSFYLPPLATSLGPSLESGSAIIKNYALLPKDKIQSLPLLRARGKFFRLSPPSLSSFLFVPKSFLNFLSIPHSTSSSLLSLSLYFLFLLPHFLLCFSVLHIYISVHHFRCVLALVLLSLYNSTFSHFIFNVTTFLRSFVLLSLMIFCLSFISVHFFCLHFLFLL
jgi:hypothetical protein